ncbi:hypothetical protein [Oceanisphaera psychrotolerans]|nr:hypothetical protein [Oceanisphaera psychrotolerans]
MSRQPGWLALAMALLVISLCLSQRLGLVSGCVASAHQSGADQLAAPDHPDNLDNESQCDLSEQLLSKVWNQLEPLLIGLLLVLPWLPLPGTRWYRRLRPPPRPFAERRRHLVLCVFRE